MRAVRVEDYYTEEDRRKDLEKIQMYFDHSKETNIFIDGSGMISKFVKPITAAQMHLTLEERTKRNEGVNLSKERLETL
jgi:hypothetical protein